MVRVRSAIRLRNLLLPEAVDPDRYVALAGFSQVISGLHSQPKISISTQSRFQTQSHVRGDCRLTADNAMELLTRDAKACGRTRHREPQVVEIIFHQ